MLTIKAEIQRDKLRQDGTYNVKIRFTKGKQVKRLSTSLFVTKADFLQDFMNFLLNESRERAEMLKKKGKRVPSTRCTSLYLMSIRKLFNEAVKQYNKPDQGLIRIKNTPFAYFHIPKQEATRKRAITAEQIRKMAQLPYQTIYKGIHHTNRFNLAKDCFILSFCMIGINSVDLFNATEYDGRVLTYYRTKTKGRRMDKAKMVVDVPRFFTLYLRNTRIDQASGYSTSIRVMSMRKPLTKLSTRV